MRFFAILLLGFSPLLAQDEPHRVSTPFPIPNWILNQLPKDAYIPMRSPINKKEEWIEYQTGGRDPDEVLPNIRSYVAFVRDARIVSRIEVEQRDGGASGNLEMYSIVPNHPGILALAFRHIDVDGSGTLFLVVDLSPSDKVRVLFSKTAAQAKLVLRKDGFSVWSAQDDPSLPLEERCVWCNHTYRITDYSLKGGNAQRVASHRTKERLDPEHVIERLIEVR